eukprot:1156056-Pelagomonas_calceolata.AAC.10
MPKALQSLLYIKTPAESMGIQTANIMMACFYTGSKRVHVAKGDTQVGENILADPQTQENCCQVDALQQQPPSGIAGAKVEGDRAVA